MTRGFVKDDAVRASSIRGAGTEAFASGADISEFEEHRKDTGPRSATTRRPKPPTRPSATAPSRRWRMIFGYCMGGAMALAMACDLRFAAEGSQVRHPGRAAEHRLPARAGRPARRPRRARPTRRTSSSRRAPWSDRRRSPSASSSDWCPPAELEAHTYDYLRGSPTTRRCPCAAPRSRRAYLRGHRRGAPRAAARALSRDRREPGLQGRHARVPREAAPRFQGRVSPAPVRIAFLSSTPPSPHRGQRHVRRARRPRARPRAPRPRVDSPPPAPPHRLPHLRPLALQRRAWRGPAAAPPTSWSASISTASCGRGRRGRRRFVVALKGIIADELRNERGLVRALLGVQARWERREHRAGRSRGRAQPLLGRRGQRSVRRAGARHRGGARADRPGGVAPALRRRPPRRAARARPCSRWRASTRASGWSTCCRPPPCCATRIPALRVRIVGDGPECAALRALHARPRPRRRR